MTGSEAFRSATAIRDGVASGRMSARDVVAETLRRIDALDPRLGAFLHVDRDGAMERAEELDKKVRQGTATGRLLGVPVAVKDNLCTRGMPTTAGSRILEGYQPPYDAHAVTRLREEGAILVGKTNLDEFGMGSSTENSAWKPTRNPWDLERVPGGSSGGSAAAVAAGLVPLALGSDTGGSIRQPAALCGVVGFKPTYGSVSRYGLIAFASSLDTVGAMGASVMDVVQAHGVLSGHDARDATSLPNASIDSASSLSHDVRGLRIGVHRAMLEGVAHPGIRDALLKAVESLREAGARIVRLDDLDLLLRHAVSTYYLVATSEASSNLARFDGMRYGPRVDGADLRATYAATRGSLFGAEVKRRILLGTYALSEGYYEAFYDKALRVRRLFRRVFEQVFSRVEVLIGAASACPAFPLGQNVQDPLAMYQCDLMTIPPSLAGLPAASVPCGLADGLPVGLQIVGPPQGDSSVLQVAFAYERRSGWRGRLAPLSDEVAAGAAS